jgi:predicted  nucleic acid-binding Zn-ribbon protein
MFLEKNSVYLLVGLVAISGMFLSPIYADVVSPKKQLSLDIKAEKIVCKTNFVKIIKAGNNEVACVKPTTAEKLVKAGWAKPVDQKIIDMVKNRISKGSVGTVKTIATTNIAGDAGRLDLTPRTVAFNYIFEVCALENSIRAPTVVVTSDSETKTVKLVENLAPNKCSISAVVIKSSNKDAIKATLVNKGEVTNKLNELENKVSDLKTKLADEKKKIAPAARGEVKPENYDQMAGEATDKIVNLRNELNMAQEELHRYLFSLYVTPQKFDKKVTLSFGGTPVEGTLVKKLSVTKQLGGADAPKGYSVVYEVCAGSQIIRAPTVNVKTDMETKTIKLGDKVSPNSCQLGTAKINAEDKESIQVTLGNNGDATKVITDLENKIADLQAMVAKEKQELEELTKIAQKPADYEKRVSDLVKSISDKRTQINEAKAKLHGLFYKYYGAILVSTN